MVHIVKLVVLLSLSVIALALIIAGSAMLGSNKSCQTTDDACVTAEKRRKGGVAMVVIGVILAISAILFGVFGGVWQTNGYVEHKDNDSSTRTDEQLLLAKAEDETVAASNENCGENDKECLVHKCSALGAIGDTAAREKLGCDNIKIP